MFHMIIPVLVAVYDKSKKLLSMNLIDNAIKNESIKIWRVPIVFCIRFYKINFKKFKNILFIEDFV